jgi:hypothetical protein
VELYGEGFVSRFFALEQFPALLDRYRIAWVLLEPQNPRKVVLDQMHEWYLAYADDIAVIYLRKH